MLSTTRRKIGHPVECPECLGGVLVPDTTSDDPSQPSHGETWDDLVDTSVIEGPMGGTVEITRVALYSVGGLIVGVAIVAFLLGWSLGGQFGGAPADSRSIARSISGTLHYTTRRGGIAADSEAVVAAFPVQHRPDEKLEPMLFRPNVAPSEVPSERIQVIRSWGGDFARTDGNGGFELRLPGPGEYFLLLISNHSKRSHDHPITSTEAVEIGRYVRATEAIEANDFVWRKQLITQSISIEHVFGRE